MFYPTHHHHFLFNFPQFHHFPQLQEMESAGEDSIEAEIGDDFSVDELLDLSNGYSETEEHQFEETELKPAPLFPEKDEAPFPPDDLGEICFQAEGLESLEWVSHFMDDSFPDHALAAEKSEAQPCESFTNPVQRKARTKRVWHVASTAASFGSEKRRRSGAGAAAQGRRCSHCGATKTPQWRAGPEGAKTLCNACGVRYKSGRLVPEYRPACSPYFSTEMHSNNHRKVLEMRRKKEMEMEMEISNSDGIL